jgi:hypothetical protein
VRLLFNLRCALCYTRVQSSHILTTEFSDLPNFTDINLCCMKVDVSTCFVALILEIYLKTVVAPEVLLLLYSDPNSIK